MSGLVCGARTRLCGVRASFLRGAGADTGSRKLILGRSGFFMHFVERLQRIGFAGRICPVCTRIRCARGSGVGRVLVAGVPSLRPPDGRPGLASTLVGGAPLRLGVIVLSRGVCATGLGAGKRAGLVVRCTGCYGGPLGGTGLASLAGGVHSVCTGATRTVGVRVGLVSLRVFSGIRVSLRSACCKVHPP